MMDALEGEGEGITWEGNKEIEGGWVERGPWDGMLVISVGCRVNTGSLAGNILKQGEAGCQLHQILRMEGINRVKREANSKWKKLIWKMRKVIGCEG